MQQIQEIEITGDICISRKMDIINTLQSLKLDGCGVFLGRSEYKDSNTNLSLVGERC